jgi:hypothetical protein
MESVYILRPGGEVAAKRERMMGTDPECKMLCFKFYFKHVRVENPKLE